MAIGWYIVPYKRREVPYGSAVKRYCAMDEYTAQLRDVGGVWTETEVLGNRAIVKVSAPAAALNVLDAVDNFRRLPKNRLDDPLSDLPGTALVAIRDELLDAGYPLAEIRDRFGDDLSQYTLYDVLRFLARRRLKPRYDAETDEIILDGEAQACRTLESVDAEVQ